VLTQADSLPTLAIYDADNSTSPITGYSNAVVTDEPDPGVYSTFVGYGLTQTAIMLELQWSYAVNGLPVNQNDFYSVETEYASVSEIIDFLGFGATPSEANFRPINEIVSAEKVARTIVEGYTGQKFWTYTGSQEVVGIGADTIQLTERIIRIDQVFENDVLVIDNTQDPAYNTFGYPLEISPTGFAVRLYYPWWTIRDDAEWDPTILYYGKFRDGSRYKFQGQMGYKYVPADIKIATMLLVNDIMSNDYNWRNKYLSKVNLSEISFEMHAGAFNGTGNITVDNILDQYRHVNIVII
jgi:hypothetical protein